MSALEQLLADTEKAVVLPSERARVDSYRAELTALLADRAKLHKYAADYERATEQMQSKFCANLRAWRNAIDAATERKGEWTREQLAEIDLVFLWITKSDLLNRLVYKGEKVRTRMCPKHKGRWCGLPSEPPPCGCGLTGWLPEVAS